MAIDEEKPKAQEKEISMGEQKVEFQKESEPVIENKEILRDKKAVADELRREIELMDIDENLKKQAEQKAQKISFLGEQEKIEHLLRLAREKGLVFAIKTAKEMKDPYLLDVLHDVLAKEGYYKNFSK